MSLSAANTWTYKPRGTGADVCRFLVLSSEVIYHGALVVIDKAGGTPSTEGYLKNMDNSSGTDDIFAGIAIPSDNYVTGDSSSVWCPVDVSGPTVTYVSVTGASGRYDIGDLVYATDENTLTLSAATYTKAVGIVTRWYSSTYCDVKLFSMMEYKTYMLD